ncbi:hypothetical protein [Actinomycetospora sp. NBC_00405]|uniref:hypothetical protein n=1 Tax=Actinomycetospora sp. NBC_00405 TaxID=2975952 RepID=UPI002E24C4FF
MLEAAVVVGEHHPPLAAVMPEEHGPGVAGEHGPVAGDRARELVESEGRRKSQAELGGPAANATRAGLGPVEHRREVLLGKVPEVEDALRRRLAGGGPRGVGTAVVGGVVVRSGVVRRARSAVGPGAVGSGVVRSGVVGRA